MKRTLITIAFMLILSMDINAQTETEYLTMSLTGYGYNYTQRNNGSLVTTIYSGTCFFCAQGVYVEQGQKTEKYSFDDTYTQYSYSGKWWIDHDQNGNARLNRYIDESKKTTTVKIAIIDGLLYLNGEVVEVQAVNCY